jgi:hypothetical protein
LILCQCIHRLFRHYRFLHPTIPHDILSHHLYSIQPSPSSPCQTPNYTPAAQQVLPQRTSPPFPLHIVQDVMAVKSLSVLPKSRAINVRNSCETPSCHAELDNFLPKIKTRRCHYCRDQETNHKVVKNVRMLRDNWVVTKEIDCVVMCDELVLC